MISHHTKNQLVLSKSLAIAHISFVSQPIFYANTVIKQTFITIKIPTIFNFMAEPQKKSSRGGKLNIKQRQLQCVHIFIHFILNRTTVDMRLAPSNIVLLL